MKNIAFYSNFLELLNLVYYLIFNTTICNSIKQFFINKLYNFILLLLLYNWIIYNNKK
jgi:hypothetical protein